MCAPESHNKIVICTHALTGRGQEDQFRGMCPGVQAKIAWSQGATGNTKPKGDDVVVTRVVVEEVLAKRRT